MTARSKAGWLRLWPLTVIASMQLAVWLGGPDAGWPGQSAAWPSLAHPLGIDGLGRDFLWVLVLGTERFALPGLAAVALMLLAAMGFVAIARTAGGPPLRAARAAATWAGALPRLLIVMLVVMALPSPSPWVLAGVVWLLYVPLVLDELTVRLEVLRREQVLLGARAHGLPPAVILWRHLARGHLKPMLLGHAAYLFVQVALTEVAVAYVFGASAVMSGLGASWGAELRRLMGRIPHPGVDPCPISSDPCVAWIESGQALVLITVVAVLIGGVLALGRAWRGAEVDRT
jgi:peptide/nickel transport system permease protein